MDPDRIRRVVEAALLASDGPLNVASLVKLFTEDELDGENAPQQIRAALKTLEEEAEHRGVELKRVASGYRYQVRQDLSEWVSRLWDEKPPRYTRALLETLALVAYKQPVTRGDIEQVRGVSVSQNIMRTLMERDWIRVVGQKEVPGRPSMYGTTKGFLDYFNLKSLDELPPLAEIRALIEPALVEEEPRPVREMPSVEGPDEDAGLHQEPTSHTVSGDFEEQQADELMQDNSGVTAHVEMPGDADVVPAEPDQGEDAGDHEGDQARASAEVVHLHSGSQQPTNG